MQSDRNYDMSLEKNESAVHIANRRLGKSRYRADIDGLRAIAIICVVMFHAKLGVVGGFVGVDVFFVISGFLITDIVWRELASGEFDFGRFIERRINRILPATIPVLLSTTILSWVLFLPNDVADFGKSLVAQSLGVANFYFWRTSGYFSGPAETKPLLHFWSLAVEIQYYLILPFLLFLLRKQKPRSVLVIMFVVTACSFAVSVYGTGHYPSATFYLLPARAWEMSVGSILALAFSAGFAIRSRATAESLSALGCIAIAWSSLSFNEKTTFPGMAALLPVLGAALLIASGTGTVTTISKMLSAKSIVFVGLISYSLYLWHWPVFVFSEYWNLSNDRSILLKLLQIVFAVILAILSWKFIEVPFRRGIGKDCTTSAFRAFFLSVIFAGGTGLFVQFASALQSEAGGGNWQRIADADRDRAFLNEMTHEDAQSGRFVKLGPAELKLNLFVLGDSHAMAVIPAIDSLCEKYKVRAEASTHSSTPPLLDSASLIDSRMQDSANAYHREIIQYIADNRVRNVLLVADWFRYVRVSAELGEPDLLKDGLEEFISELRKTGTRIWILRPIPRLPYSENIPRLLAKESRFGDISKIGVQSEAHVWQSREANLLLDRVSSTFQIRLLDVTISLTNEEGFISAVVDMKPLYCDTNHLTISGSLLTVSAFEPLFESILEEP